MATTPSPRPRATVGPLGRRAWLLSLLTAVGSLTVILLVVFAQ